MLCCLAVFVVPGLDSLYADERITKVYPLGFADEEALEEYTAAMIGDEGRFVIDRSGRRLIIAASPEQHRKIAELLDALDQPPRNVLIDVRFIETGREHQSGLEIGGDGEIVLGGPGTAGTIVLGTMVHHRTADMSLDTSMNLLVSSGREGLLQIGERVPYLDWIVDYGIFTGTIASGVEWQQVGAYLAVEPTVIGNGPFVEIVLTPRLSGLVNDSPYHVSFSEISTEVTVRDGESFNLGGMAAEKDFYSRFLVGVDRSGSRRSIDIQLTPRIQDAQHHGR